MPHSQIVTLRRQYLEDNAFEFLIGMLSIVAALAFFLNPDDLDRSAIGQLIHPFDFLWNSLYLAGGSLIVAGLTMLRPRFERSGLWLLSSAVTANLIAILYIGLPSLGAYLSIAVYLATIGACLTRLHVITRKHR